MGYFPFFVDLEGQPGLIVGGGTVALRKADKLLPYGPHLTVVSPHILPELERIPGSLDDFGGDERNASAGQLMAYINEPTGRICSWGIPLAEAYGIRLPADYAGDVPAPLQLMDVPEGEYVVFEYGPFDYETENAQVEAEIERAMKEFDYAAHGVQLDTAQGRVFYFYHDCTRFWKYVRPVKRVEGILGQ